MQSATQSLSSWRVWQLTRVGIASLAFGMLTLLAVHWIARADDVSTASVAIHQFAFDPTPIEVPAGTTIT